MHREVAVAPNDAPTAAVPVFSFEDVTAAVAPAEAVSRTRDAFERFTRGEWVMPPKVYLTSEPHGDFRAMPARSDELAMLKWVSSFPANVGTAVPTVAGVIALNSAVTGELLALIDGRSVTALRTGAAAAVAAAALARDGANTVSIIGCGVHGAWTGRCLAAAGYTQGVCSDPDAGRAGALADELGWSPGTIHDALACDVVNCVTPGRVPVVTTSGLRPGQHFNMLGADGPGKAEATVDAVVACALFCDDWAQASHGGELTGAVGLGLVDQATVTQLGDVLLGRAPGRASAESTTMFDSTGLAIQDLGIASAVLELWRAGAIDARRVQL